MGTHAKLDIDRKVLDKIDWESTLVQRFAGSLDEEHGDRREEISRTESFDESNEEAVTERH